MEYQPNELLAVSSESSTKKMVQDLQMNSLFLFMGTCFMNHEQVQLSNDLCITKLLDKAMCTIFPLPIMSQKVGNVAVLGSWSCMRQELLIVQAMSESVGMHYK